MAPNTGTRLGSRKVCLTEAEWQERQERDRQRTENSQATGLMGAPAGQ
jgi:hypothetical protein